MNKYFLYKKLGFLCLLLLLGNGKYLQGQTLIARYTCDNNAADISGYKNDGRIIGGVSATTDRFGNKCGALNFNGTNGYIEVPNSPSLESVTQSFSVTCWFRIENVPMLNGYKWLTLICKGNQSIETANNPQFRLQTFQSDNQSTISINTDLTEFDDNFSRHKFEFNKWNFYALVYDGVYIRTFLNNVKIWEFPYNKYLISNTDPLFIGKDVPGSLEMYCGSLDDIRIYNSYLDDNAIAKIFRDDSNELLEDEFTIVCTKDIIKYTDKNKCDAVVNYTVPALEINCGSASMHLISGLVSGSSFPVGVSRLTFEASNTSGFKKTCYTDISVIDKEVPVMHCAKDTILFIKNSNDNTLRFDFKIPISSDNCPGVNTQQVNGISSGNNFPIGTTQLKFKAIDKSGNISECVYNVIVKKSIPPAVASVTPVKKLDSLECPADIKKYNDSHKCGATINYSLNRNEQELKLIKGSASGSFFKVGSTQNRFSLISSTTECSFNIVVIDNEKPELICPSDTIVYLSHGEKKATIFYNTPVATDNCHVDSIKQIAGISSRKPFPVGTTQNIFKATDKSDNSSTCSFNVIVIDSTSKKSLPDSVEVKQNLISDEIHYTKPIDFNTCIITILMYDDGTQDFDSISAFFNGKEIVAKELIMLKKNGIISRALMLNQGEKNDLVIKAWNTGQISPNTLKIDFYEGYYVDNLKKIKNKKPFMERRLHAKPGVAAGIYLNCKPK